jgi:hypothetical protein
MSALRITQPGCHPTFVDLGPERWVPIHGRATLRGHIARPMPAGFISPEERAANSEYKRLHRAPSTPESRARDAERCRRRRARVAA